MYALFEPGLEILLSRAEPETLDNYSARPDMNLWPLGLVLTLIQPSTTTKWEHKWSRFASRQFNESFMSLSMSNEQLALKKMASTR